MGENYKLIANNKKAYFDYFIEDKYEAGIALHGTEVKSLRMGKCSLKESYIRIENGEVYKAFSYDCDKFDVLRKSANRNAPLPIDIAIWNKQNDGIYDISVLRWNGIQFEPVPGDYSDYYGKKAVPYLAMKAKYAPYSAANWYNLAVALVKAGAYRDALTAINVGIDMDRDGTFKDRFLALRSELR